jgi:purine-binding chemotaxis protein CheW
VDSVSEVLRISDSTVEPPPALVAGVESDYIEGVGKLDNRLLILLELKKIFSASDRKELEKATNN